MACIRLISYGSFAHVFMSKEPGTSIFLMFSLCLCIEHSHVNVDSCHSCVVRYGCMRSHVCFMLNMLIRLTRLTLHTNLLIGIVGCLIRAEKLLRSISHAISFKFQIKNLFCFQSFKWLNTLEFTKSTCLSIDMSLVRCVLMMLIDSIHLIRSKN